MITLKSYHVQSVLSDMLMNYIYFVTDHNFIANSLCYSYKPAQLFTLPILFLWFVKFARKGTHIHRYIATRMILKLQLNLKKGIESLTVIKS